MYTDILSIAAIAISLWSFWYTHRNYKISTIADASIWMELECPQTKNPPTFSLWVRNNSHDLNMIDIQASVFLQQERLLRNDNVLLFKGARKEILHPAQTWSSFPSKGRHDEFGAPLADELGDLLEVVSNHTAISSVNALLQFAPNSQDSLPKPILIQLLVTYRVGLYNTKSHRRARLYELSRSHNETECLGWVLRPK